MKLNKIIFKISTFLILIIICNSCICYAENENLDYVSTTSESGSPLGSSLASGVIPNLDSYKPTAQGNGIITNATNKILGVIIILGVVLITVFIAITGFETILGSSEEKAVAKEKFGGYLIATMIITCGAALAKIIIKLAESFQ